MPRAYQLTAILLLGLLWPCAAVCAQPPATAPASSERFFEYQIEWNDAQPGVATDVSFLNDAPAGRNGRIVARDGHFYEADGGRRVRFLGVNLGSEHAFPDKPYAEVVALHLARSGINVARLHHLDNTWSIASGGSLWDPSRPDRQQFDAGQLDRLDYLVAQLKSRGIYINLNLKVSKELTAADGMPESIAQVLFTHQKRLDYFQPRMVELQKDYARRLLTHVNPYTKLSYAEDPAVAFVEINNENALLAYWIRYLGRDLDKLPEPFLGELAALWTRWLKDKYGSDAALTAAWKDPSRHGPSIIDPRSRWTVVGENGAKVAAIPSQSGDAVEPGALGISIEQVGGAEPDAQAHLAVPPLEPGQSYTVSFAIRADRLRPVGITVTQAEPPHHLLGLATSVAGHPQWEPHALVFRASSAAASGARLTFLLGRFTGQVEIRDIELRPGAAGGLSAGESIENGVVAVPRTGTVQQWDDWVAFLSDVERGYADQMLDYLRQLGVKATIVLTQIDYGGMGGLRREKRMDFADAHAYWQHPEFPGSDWNPGNWRIANTPQVAAMNEQRFGAFGDLAMIRVAGKPYTISEYDHPAPSDYVAELMPTLASFAALQDWDGLYMFAVRSNSALSGDQGIQGYFDQGNHPAKWAFYPSAALIFRLGLIEPLGASATLRVPDPPWLPYGNADDAWRELSPDGRIGFLEQRLMVSDVPLAAGEAPRLEISGQRAAGQVSLVPTPLGQAFVAASPSAAVFAGHVGGASLSAGDVRLQTAEFGNGFAGAVVVATDAKPLAASNRILVTVGGQAHNQDMGWDAGRTTVGANWGHGPTVAEYVPVTLTIPAEGPRKVYVLDSSGVRRGEAACRTEQGSIVLETSPSDRTMLYEITAP
jgi:hypothetical protein